MKKKFSQNKFKKFSTLFDTTFQCGCCYVKKFNFSFFFGHEKTDKKVAHNRPKPFYSTVQPRPQPTAQNWFSILWNLGTRHLFSYLWCMGIWNMKKYEAHISDDNSLLSQLVEKRTPLLWKSYLKAAFIIKLNIET